jgi:thymidine phosphorylase
VHVLAGAKFAPADADMFAHRQRVGAQAIPALAIASLLAKKLAMGVQCVGLEIRVSPHGNFGAGRKEAATNAEMFLRAARLLEMEATCFLTDGTIPQQPYLGRSEALLALSRLLTSTAASWLQDHATMCEGWATTLAGSRPPLLSAVARAFCENIMAQGGSMDALEQIAEATAAAHSRRVLAVNEGIVSYDLGLLRQAILEARPPDRDGNFDDSAGLILLAKPGRVVRTGEPLISARCPDRVWPALRDLAAAATHLADPGDISTPTPVFGTLEVIGVGAR